MPISFPFPVRVSVGLIATGVDQLRRLPGDLPSLGVTAAGQAMRLSMRMQQEFAELATRGDEVLSLIGGQPADHPAWATFDEEETEATGSLTVVATGAPDTEDTRDTAHTADHDGFIGNPMQELAEVIALDLVVVSQSVDRTEDDQSDPQSPIETDADGSTDSDGPDDADSEYLNQDGVTESADDDDGPPAASIGSADNGAVESPDDYETLTLAELRGKLRRLSADQVTDLLGRERAGADRPPFITLLSNRLTTMEQGHS